MKKNTLGLQIALFTVIRVIATTAYRMVYPFLPAFRDALGVSVDTLTYAVGSRSLVAAVLGPLVAPLGDLRGRKAGMLTGMLVFLAGMAVVIFWPTFPGFVIALMLSLLGKVTFDPTAQAYIADHVPYSRRSFALSVIEVSWSGAYILMMPVVGWLIARTNWIAPFYLLAGLTILTGLIFYRHIPPDKPREGAPVSLRKTYGAILSSPPALAGMALTLIACMANELLSLNFGIWLEDAFALKLAALGGTAALVGVAELSGEGLVATITDRLGKRRAIVTGLLVNCVAVIGLLFVGGSLLAAEAALFLFYISFEFYIVSSIPLMTEVMPQARTTMMAGFFTSASVGRWLASLMSPSLAAAGFGWIVAVTVLLNLVAIFSMRGLRVAAEEERQR